MNNLVVQPELSLDISAVLWYVTCAIYAHYTIIYVIAMIREDAPLWWSDNVYNEFLYLLIRRSKNWQWPNYYNLTSQHKYGNDDWMGLTWEIGFWVSLCELYGIEHTYQYIMHSDSLSREFTDPYHTYPIYTCVKILVVKWNIHVFLGFVVLVCICQQISWLSTFCTSLD